MEERVERRPTSASRRPKAQGRVAVVDIGSNTVRLVVYDTPTRLPFPMFNEKAMCELGRGVGKTGRLNPKGVRRAMATLSRFVRLADAMGVERLDLLATAAVREAEDGPAFVEGVRDAFGLAVKVLDSEEEARLGALGLLSGVPDADGLLGDLGGGSLDLVVLDRGSFGRYATLPLGHLTLADLTRNHPAKAATRIAELFEGQGWLREIRGRTVYAVGGACRALARLFIEQTGYPLHVVDNYAIERAEARRLTRLIGHLSHATMDRVLTVPKRRAENLPYAAMVLGALLDVAQPKALVFSGFSMREGQLLQGLPRDLREQDPLISGCATQAERTGRFSIRGDEIMDWISPLFPDGTDAERRLRRAACLLSDIGWNEHPDYRAEHAFHRTLRLPFAGLTHPDRVALALAVYVRYNGDPESPLVAPVRVLIDEGRLAWARTLGLALRLAHTISGSAPGVLAPTALRVGRKSLSLAVPGSGEGFVSETVERRLKTLARSMGLKGRIAEES